MAETISGIISGRQGHYFYPSDENVYYLLLWRKKRKRKKWGILSIKNDTQHHWDPLQKSADTLSPIIHKTLLLWSAATCFLPLMLFPTPRPRPPPSSEDCSFNVLSHLSGFECALHLVFTMKLIVHVCWPCSRPALPGKGVWPCLECQTLQATCDPGRSHLREKLKYYPHFFVSARAECHCHWTVCHGSSFWHDSNIKERTVPGFRSAY